MMRSKATAELDAGELPRETLLGRLAPAPSRAKLSIPNGDLADHLGPEHKSVKAVRDRNAAIIAVHQLEQERVIQEAPVGVSLVFAEVVRGNRMHSTTSTNETFAEPIGIPPISEAGLFSSHLPQEAGRQMTTRHSIFLVT